MNEHPYSVCAHCVMSRQFDLINKRLCLGISEQTLLKIPSDKITSITLYEREYRGVSHLLMAKIGCEPLGKFAPDADKQFAAGIDIRLPRTPEQIAADKKLIEAAEESKREAGRLAWKKIHELAATDSLTMPILNAILAMIGGCGGCAKDAGEYLLQYPLPTSGQYQWSVDWHNAVNAKLGKPLFLNPK